MAHTQTQTNIMTSLTQSQPRIHYTHKDICSTNRQTHTRMHANSDIDTQKHNRQRMTYNQVNARTQSSQINKCNHSDTQTGEQGRTQA